jgi:hypothetical protein
MCRWWICVGYVEVLQVMGGGVVCACLRGRKSCGESDVLSWLMLYCRLIFLMCGSGCPIPIQSYLVVGAYHFLTHLTSKELPIYCDLVWNKFVPLKVFSFAW